MKKLFEKIFDDKKEVLDTTKVVDNKKEVYVVKSHRPVTEGGFPWEVKARDFDLFEQRRKQEQRLALMGRN